MIGVESSSRKVELGRDSVMTFSGRIVVLIHPRRKAEGRKEGENGSKVVRLVPPVQR